MRENTETALIMWRGNPTWVECVCVCCRVCVCVLSWVVCVCCRGWCVCAVMGGVCVCCQRRSDNRALLQTHLYNTIIGHVINALIIMLLKCTVVGAPLVTYMYQVKVYRIEGGSFRKGEA